MHGTLTPTSGEHATRRLLDQLWQRNLPTTHSRIALFTAAAEAARNGVLTPALREQATTEAHKLAGSLGMFGYGRGTDLAREIELYLESTAAVDSHHLTTLTAQLNSVLFPSN